MNNFGLHIICVDNSIKKGLQALNKISMEHRSMPMNLFVVDKQKRLLGTLTDGDIRRGLLQGKTLEHRLTTIMNKDFYYLEKGHYALEKIKRLREYEINLVPILDQHQIIKGILDLTKKESLLPVDAVIMAGGEGKRLRPLTEDIPKPLLKVGKKPIIDYILDRIDKFGIANVRLSVNYLAGQLIRYLEENGSEWDFNIRFIKEDQPLGTIGALSLVDDFEHDAILLTNADLLSTINYESFYEFFIETNADVAVASIPYDVSVPYGIFETNGTKILSIQEKPQYSYFSNAGIYLLKKEVLSLIPQGDYLDVTNFLKLLIKKNKRVTYFPLLGYWQDIGHLEDYQKVQNDIKLIDVYK